MVASKDIDAGQEACNSYGTARSLAQAVAFVTGYWLLASRPTSGEDVDGQAAEATRI